MRVKQTKHPDYENNVPITAFDRTYIPQLGNVICPECGLVLSEIGVEVHKDDCKYNYSNKQSKSVSTNAGR